MRKISRVKKSFFVVIDGSEDVLYLKCLDLYEATNEVKRFLDVEKLDDFIEIIYNEMS
jgi:hypothetical protein